MLSLLLAFVYAVAPATGTQPAPRLPPVRETEDSVTFVSHGLVAMGSHLMLELVGLRVSLLFLTSGYEPSTFGAMSCVAFSTVASGGLASDAEEEEAVDGDKDDQRQADFDDYIWTSQFGNEYIIATAGVTHPASEHHRWYREAPACRTYCCIESPNRGDS